MLTFSALDTLATHYPQDSTASQRPGHPMPNGFIDNSGDSQFSQTTESALAQHPQSKNTIEQDPKEVDQHLVDAKMEEAKEALRDLHSHGFGFNQIVNAGLNPGILRRLYNKVEVSVNASSGLLQRKTTKHGVVELPPESASGNTHERRRPEVSQKVSDGNVSRNGTMPHQISEEAKINGQPTLAAAKNERKSIEIQASSAKSSQTPNVNPLGKASGIKASGAKIVDRKEYIARMLAAKAGKPAVSASTPVPSQTSAITDTGAHAETRLSAIPAPIVSAAIPQGPCDFTDSSLGTPKGDLDVETKRKAQTDLARQKIEALKLRESFQQQARSATNNNQQSPAKGAPSVPSERSAPTSQHLPNRQSSYFSPASQKPPFNIPGLFMTSDALETANPSKPSAGDDSIVTLQAVGDAIFGSSQEILRPHAATSAESLTVKETSTLSESSVDLDSTLPATIPTTSSSNRKRQRASDFNDSLSIKVKRPLGQQADTAVIIDISDDDISNDTCSGDESLETADRRDSLPRGPQVIASGNGNKNAPQSLPSLTDLPQRKKSVIMTPPTTQASGQNGDLNGLKSKEMEIEVMNRKIAELEQRVASKAKQNPSRSHSPRTSSRVTTSPPSGRSSNQIKNPPNIPLSLSDSQDGAIANFEKREPSTTLAETNEAAAAEQLNVVQQLEHVARAKAEVERSLAAQITLVSAADQPLTQEEDFQTRQAEENLNFVDGKQRSKDEEQELALREESRLEESQSHQLRGEETMNYRQEEEDRYLQKRQRMLEPAAPQEYLQEQERKRSLDDQRQARKSEIELGLPLLDAEVEKTRKRLESLRQEMASLETQLQKGIEGRQGLIEELHMLSRSREALPKPVDLEPCDVREVPKQSTSTGDLTGKCPYERRPLTCSK